MPPLLPSHRIVMASRHRVFAYFRDCLFGWLLHCRAVSHFFALSRCVVPLRCHFTLRCIALSRLVVTTRHLVVLFRHCVAPLVHLIMPALFCWLLSHRAASCPCFPFLCILLLQLAIVLLAAVVLHLVSLLHCVLSSRPVA